MPGVRVPLVAALLVLGGARAGLGQPPRVTVTAGEPAARGQTPDSVAASLPVGPVVVAGSQVHFDDIARLAGAGTLPAAIGCASCGAPVGTCDGTCAPFPATGSFAGRFVGCLYDTLCCPDPCYRPRWEPLTDTAFVTAAARPVTQTRLQWNYTNNIPFADRGEFIWARADGRGRGPAPQFGAVGVPRVDIHELQQVTEAASGRASVSVATPYRSVNPQFAGSAAGFGDITINAKSLLLDTELLLVSFQFGTTVPAANPRKGTGTGHVSLEPSAIFGLRLGPESYLQGQLAEWIPLGGDPTYSGAVLHYHLAYNRTLWKPTEAVKLIGTLEGHGYSFQDGGFTDPALGFRKASDHTSGQLGVGARLFLCDQYDFGVGGVFGVTGANLFGSQLRVEARVRY